MRKPTPRLQFPTEPGFATWLFCLQVTVIVYIAGIIAAMTFNGVRQVKIGVSDVAMVLTGATLVYYFRSNGKSS